MIKKLSKTQKASGSKSAKTGSGQLNSNLWYNRHNRLGLIVVVLIFVVAGYFLLFSHAATPTAPNVYLSPSSQTFGGNTTFTVQVRENSGSTAVNAVQANFSYPTSLVSFVSISSTGSSFSTVVQSTGGSGTVNIGAGVSTSGSTTTPLTGDQLVATVTFKTLTTSGAANMAFTSGTALVNSSTNTDILGSLSNTTGATTNVDVTPPTVGASTPANGATVGGGGNVTLTATASDTQSAVASVDFYIDGTKVGTATSAPYTFAWNTASVTLGSHTFQAKATDAVGNVGSSTTNTFTLADQTAPTAPTSLHTTATTTTSITLAWTAGTDNVGVTGYRIARNGTTVTTVGGTTLSYADSGLTVGTSYSYTVVALDAAGNVSTAATLSASTSAAVPGDANGDGHVTVTDLSILLSNYGGTLASCDFNHDGVVNVFDLSILLSHYGT